MPDNTFVDVAYHGFEIGTRLKLCEFGPTTAYLEHSTPLPVGTDVKLTTDDGLAITAKVMRVQEQVSGADHSPGMRLQAELSGDAQSWWSQRVTCEDPTIPEPYVAVSPVPDIEREEHGLASDTEVAATMPMDPSETPAAAAEAEPAATQAETESKPERRATVVMDAVSQEQLRAMSEKPKKRRSTAVMSAQELAEITQHDAVAGDGAGAGDGKTEGTDPGTGNGKPKKKRKRRSRKKKPT